MTIGDSGSRARQVFARSYSANCAFVATAPGRVNLIGEHTDYNDGFVLPMALPFATSIAAAPSGSDRVAVESAGYGTCSFRAGEVPADLPDWARYVAGVGSILAEEGHHVAGWNGSIDTDIPMGASLSSSAALEVAAGLAFTTAAGATIPRTELALICQRVENEVMGYQTGIMDQLISATAVDGHASLIDCRSLDATPAPLPASVLVIDTLSRRRLVDSEYDLRRASCERAAKALGVAKLRDATIDQLEAIADPTDRRRAQHVIEENQRTLDAADAMLDGDAPRLGELMDASHNSLRDLYEVSGPELDAAVDILRDIDGCLGARMTGGGFAGCCVALSRADATADVIATAQERSAAAGRDIAIWECSPSPGAHVVTGVES